MRKIVSLLGPQFTFNMITLHALGVSRPLSIISTQENCVEIRKARIYEIYVVQ